MKVNNYAHTLTHTQCATYLPRSDCLTHEDLVVGSELWWVVIDVLHPDVYTHFSVLVVTAYNHTHTNAHTRIADEGMISILLQSQSSFRAVVCRRLANCRLSAVLTVSVLTVSQPDRIQSAGSAPSYSFYFLFYLLGDSGYHESVGLWQCCLLSATAKPLEQNRLDIARATIIKLRLPEIQKKTFGHPEITQRQNSFSTKAERQRRERRALYFLCSLSDYI